MWPTGGFAGLHWVFLVLSFFHVLAIKITEVSVPRYHLSSKDVQLNCSYEHASGRPDPLYSVKWFRKDDHFYEYSPTQPSKIKAFPFPGIKVDREKSAGSSVVLTQVSRTTSGDFRCEVMGDKPLFETESLTAPMTIVDAPSWGPQIAGLRHKQKVKIGSRLQANCSVGASTPPANISWVFNGVRSSLGYKLPQTSGSDPWQDNVVHSHLDWILSRGYFQNGVLKLECLAQIYDVFHKSKVISIIDEDRPEPNTNRLWWFTSCAISLEHSYVLGLICLLVGNMSTHSSTNFE